MLVPRLQPPLRGAVASIGRTSCGNSSSAVSTSLNEYFAALNLCINPSLQFSRHASHKAQGAVNKAKDGPGKRLGAKKSGEQYVIPGNIIFRQRGTHWFPGDNCAMGRDHTIYATESGYVKYYKDIEKHPKRQYIGVVFKRDMVLPLPRNSMRRRRLGMVTVEGPGDRGMHTEAQSEDAVGENEGLLVPANGSEDEIIQSVPGLTPKKLKERRGEEGGNLVLKPGYMYRESNWEIGRAAERAKVKVREFKPRDRWTAWKKTTIRKAKNAERRMTNRKGKSSTAKAKGKGRGKGN